MTELERDRQMLLLYEGLSIRQVAERFGVRYDVTLTAIRGVGTPKSPARRRYAITREQDGMTELERLWQLYDRVHTLEQELIHVHAELVQVGRQLGQHVHVMCPFCGLEQEAPIPGDALCQCGRPLPHTPEVTVNGQVRRAPATD